MDVGKLIAQIALGATFLGASALLGWEATHSMPLNDVVLAGWGYMLNNYSRFLSLDQAFKGANNVANAVANGVTNGANGVANGVKNASTQDNHQ